MMKKEREPGKEMTRRDMPMMPRWDMWGWEPFMEVPMMRNFMRDFFGDMMKNWTTQGREMMTWQPAMDIFKKGENIVVEASLPGMKKEDISIDISDGMMTISGEMMNETEVNKDDYYYKERHEGKFSRSIMLPEEVRTENINAEFRDGLLTVTMPMMAPEKAKKVKVDIK